MNGDAGFLTSPRRSRALRVHYLHWVWWFGAHAFRADADEYSTLLALFPPVLFEQMGSVLDYGTWSLKS
ncbi:MAG: hypothetical protein AAF938_16385 [Myxococcota bacterium]